MKFIGYRTLKTAVGVVAAIYLAFYLSLDNAAAAGIIAILCLQTTRLHSIRFAAKMFAAFWLALGLSGALFGLFGYTPLIFGIFLLFFMPLAAKLRVQEGIVVNSVLTTHLLMEKQIGAAFVFNQLSLMGIGVACALFLNLFMPNFESKIKEEQDRIERLLKKILLDIAYSLKNESISLENERLLFLLQRRLEHGRKIAYMNEHNNFFLNKRDYTKYMDLRLRQLECLHQMKKDFERLSIAYQQTILVANFTIDVAQSIGNTGESRDPLDELQKLKARFRGMKLPQDREEFENRSILFQFVNDMEEFLFLESIFKKN